MKKKSVITYPHCYNLYEEVELCDKCEAKYPYPLGSPNHGRHLGYCEGVGCSDETSQEEKERV